MKSILLLCLFNFLCCALMAQPGTLDVSFGDKGKVLSTTQSGIIDAAKAIIIKNDGKILAAGGDYSFDAPAFFL